MKNVNELLGFPTFQRDMKYVNETIRDSHFSAWQSSPWQEAAHRDIRLRCRVRPILQRADIWKLSWGTQPSPDWTYKEQISEYKWKLSWGTQPSPDRSYEEQISKYQKRMHVEIVLGRHNHHLHCFQNSRTTTNDPHNIFIACVDNPRWQQAGPQPWIIKKPQQATTIIDHHNSYAQVCKNLDDNQQSSCFFCVFNPHVS